MLRAYKFLIVPVLQQIDEDGHVSGELEPRSPDVAFGLDGLQAYVDGFEEALLAKEASILNGARSD